MIYQETEEYEKGFAQYFQNHLELEIKRMEKVRLRYLGYFKKICMILIPIVVFGIFLSLNQGLIGLFNLCIFSLIIIVIICAIPYFIYRYKARGKLMPKIVRFFGDFSYKDYEESNNELFLSSKLIPHYTSYRSKDKIKGIYKDVSIEIADMEFVKTGESSESKIGTTVFEGFIILLSMNKNFAGQTIITKDQSNMFNSLNEKYYSLETVKLEDPYFEKLFEVYSSDQIEARYLLTTAFMERVVKLYETFGNMGNKRDKRNFKDEGIWCSFFDNHLMITIPINKNMFEPVSLFRPSYDLKGIKTVLKEIYYTLSIIDILKLNEKIGL